ncbi:DUF805 domain-containing protein [Asticcacaulis sp. ZE23SCel15]|uniref:DUF805 domain-containing protein n=1 Tax=Asticcacaulis sp. ZE23SCel15 TaxID=3059027 RepID=UPI00266044AD|nr:DUF805 domain-containing protein [Asticcacaulis sp. ZE23SCel15]WKL57089.1 DUF805 domain-containing protein [Asticcacaulis sp. ZE23SCel15]
MDTDAMLVQILFGLLPFFIVSAAPAILLLIKKPKPENRFGVLPARMGMGEAIQVCLKKLLDFKGRASRSEFWWFYLFNVLVNISAVVLTAMTGIEAFGAASYAFFVPGLAVGARRLHDINRSGWWQLLSFGFGIFVLIYLWAQPSQNDLEDKAAVFD